MPNAIKHDATPSLSLVINGDDTTPTLKGLTDGSRKLGNEINNATALDKYGVFELKAKGSSAFDSGGYVELYLVPSADGTNYSDGDDSTTPPDSCQVGIFRLRDVTAQQRITLWDIPLPPLKFKPLLIQHGGQNFTSVDDENQLRFGAYNSEIQ